MRAKEPVIGHCCIFETKRYKPWIRVTFLFLKHCFVFAPVKLFCVCSRQTNTPFLGSLLSLVQSEAEFEIFVMVVSFTFSVNENSCKVFTRDVTASSVGVPKQRNTSHVGVPIAMVYPNNRPRIELYSYANDFCFG